MLWSEIETEQRPARYVVINYDVWIISTQTLMHALAETLHYYTKDEVLYIIYHGDVSL